MSEAFRTGVIIKDVPGGEAVWQATFATDDAKRVVERPTRESAFAWLDAMVRAWFDDRSLIPAPDGDGVVVTPPLGADLGRGRPALAVRVRDVSPLTHAPHVAAQVTERVHHARSLLEESLELLIAEGVTVLPALTQRSLDRVATLREHLATDVYAVGPVEPVTDPERGLRVVPDVDMAGGA